MTIATRWMGWGSLLAAATGSVLATVPARPERPHRMSTVNDFRGRDFTWRAFTIEREQDEVAAQQCFDRHSGLTAVERDDDDRAKLIFVEEDGPLGACMQAARGAQPRFVRPPARVYFHQRVIDPWAPPNEPALFPPIIWHRCGAVTPSHVIAANDERMSAVYSTAEACVDNRDFMFVDLELMNDGRVRRVSVDSPGHQARRMSAALKARTACIVRAMCEYRFERPYGQLHFAVATPRTLEVADAVLKKGVRTPQPKQ